MSTTLTVIDNFSEHYPELTSWGFNLGVGGNTVFASFLGLAAMFVSIVITACVGIWLIRIDERKGRDVRFVTILITSLMATASVVAAIVIATPTFADTHLPSRDDVAQRLNSTATDKQYSELMDTVANDDTTQRHVADLIYRTTGLGSTSYDAHEMVCEHDDNEQSVLCGGEQPSTITYNDFDDELTTALTMWPIFDYVKDSDELSVEVKVRYTATN